MLIHPYQLSWFTLKATFTHETKTNLSQISVCSSLRTGNRKRRNKGILIFKLKVIDHNLEALRSNTLLFVRITNSEFLK